MKPFLIPRICAAAALAAASLCSHAVVAPVPISALYVFGDSLSDSGNNATFLGINASQPINNSYVPMQPYGSGVYSNGPVWVNSFAAGLGLSVVNSVPSLLSGHDYAYGGARTATDGAGLTPSLKTQVNGFLAATPGNLASSALYVVAGGGNDVRDTLQSALLAGVNAPAVIAAAAFSYATQVGSIVDALHLKGATHIVVWDAPDVGRTPASIAAGSFGGQSVAALATAVSAAFNTQLTLRLGSEVGVTTFDIFGLVGTIVAHPATYGFTDVVDACGGLPGIDASKCLFWDGIHPTAAAHALIASAMLSAVPEPATALMFGAGLLLLVARRRRA